MNSLKSFKYDINYLIITTSFIVYSIILLWALIFKFNNTASILEQQENYLNWDLAKRFTTPLAYPLFQSERPSRTILNFYVFIPLGLYLPLLFKNLTYLGTQLFHS